MRLLTLLLAGSLLIAAAGCQPGPWEGVTPQEFARLEAHRLRGAILLEQGRANLAVAEFQSIQKLRPRLALGYLNEAACAVWDLRQSASGITQARKAMDLMPRSAWPCLVHARLLEGAGLRSLARLSLEEAVRREPDHLRALYALDQHLTYSEGEDHSARIRSLRQRVRDLAPDNFAAQVNWLAAAEDAPHAEVRAALDQIARLAPNLSSEARPYFDAALRAARDGSPLRSVTHVAANHLRGEPQFRTGFQQLAGSPWNIADYLQKEWDVPPPCFPRQVVPTAVRWTDVTAVAQLDNVRARGTAPVAVGDLDLWPRAGCWESRELLRMQDIPHLLVGAAPERSLRGNGAGFRPPPRPLPGGSPLLADFDDDFVLDAYVCQDEGDFFWRNPLRGDTRALNFRFSRRGPSGGRRYPQLARGPGSATAADLDQDGDLDLLRATEVPGQPPVCCLRNDGGWRFTDVTTPSGLGVLQYGARQVVCADFDGDASSDVFVVRPGAGCRLFLNQRRCLFRDASEGWDLPDLAGARCAAVADYNRDGRWDLAVGGEGGLRHPTLLYRNTGRALKPEGLPLPQGFRSEWLEWLDYDNDSWLDLVVAGPDGLTLLRNEAGRLRCVAPPDRRPGRWVTSLDYDGDGDVDLLAAGMDDRLRLLRNDGGNTLPSLRIELRGYVIDSRNLSPGEESQGNNSYASGASVEAIGVWDRQAILVTRPVTHVGLGRNTRVLGARVKWTHGVTEASIGIRPNTSIVIPQCPRGW